MKKIPRSLNQVAAVFPTKRLVFYLIQAACLTVAFLSHGIGQLPPDTTINRYATSEDAAYWPTVNVGDYIIFKGNQDSGASIYARTTHLKIETALGKKILIWRGNYRRIYIQGTNCTNSTAQPTIITNLGGQVRWGENNTTSQYRALELDGFAHVHLTGKYDLAAKTGDPAYLGHNGGLALGAGDYYERYGMWGNQKWSGEIQNAGSSNVVRIWNFQTCKVNYVAAWGGGFAGFNIKTDNPPVPGTVEVDVQDCFAGFGTGEGFYISNTSEASGQDFTRLTMRNNIVVCAGAESYQTNLLRAGSVVEHNVSIGSATFFRSPFMDKVQQGLHQLTFVEGGVTVRNNIFTGGAGVQQTITYSAPGSGRLATPSTEPVLIENNYIGFGRRSAAYIHPSGDAVTPYIIRDNVYGPLSVPHSNDAYDSYDEPAAAIQAGNTSNPLTFSRNLFDPALPGFFSDNLSNLSETGSVYGEAPEVRFKNTGFPDGFDFRRLTFWTPTYGTAEKLGEPVPYKQGDFVIYYETQSGSTRGETKFFRCLADHAGGTDPNTTPAVWQQVTWSGRSMPPLDVRIEPESYYNYRGMGLTYNEVNITAPDLVAPVIALNGGDMNVPKGMAFIDPGWQAFDNRDGDLTSQVIASWDGPAINTGIAGEYYRTYRVVDSVGNVSLPATRTITVSDASVVFGRKAQVNMMRNSSTSLLGWTNVGNDSTGIRNNPDSATPAVTNTNILDINGLDTGWDLTIVDDPTAGGVSEHYGVITNASSPAIGEFPSLITKQGLQVRDATENPCRFVFTNLNPGKYYDFRYTGYQLQTTGTLWPKTAELYDLASGRSDAVNVVNNAGGIGEVRSVKPDASGQIQLVFTTGTPRQTANLSGLIIQEKSAFGYTNPVSHWKLDETSGTTAADVMGLSNGVLNGNATWTSSGNFSGGINLPDGSNDWVAAPSSALYSGSALSVSLWFNPALLDGAARGLISKRAGINSQVAFSIFLFTDNRIFVDLGTGSGGSVERFDTGIAIGNLNSWHHLVVVFDGSLASDRLKVYLNGGLPRFQTQPVRSTILNTSGPVHIGILNANYGNSFKGVIDQVKVFNKPLTQSDIDLLGKY